jgi:hypothetical protein
MYYVGEMTSNNRATFYSVSNGETKTTFITSNRNISYDEIMKRKCDDLIDEFRSIYEFAKEKGLSLKIDLGVALALFIMTRGMCTLWFDGIVEFPGTSSVTLQ